jgi:hypothetical protein
MANLLLQQRKLSQEVGLNWLIRWIRCNNLLVAKYLHKYDYQKAKYKDLKILNK